MKRALCWYLMGCLLVPLIGGAQGCMLPSRYTVPNRSATSYWRNFDKEDVTVGIDLYGYSRMQNEVFRWDALKITSQLRFVIIELRVENGTLDQIEITPKDIMLSHSGNPPLRAQVIDFKAAQRHLRNLFQLWFGTGGTFAPYFHEMLFIGIPLGLVLLPRNSMLLSRWKGVLRDNRFTYGSIAPSSSRHGFVYVELDEPGAERFSRNGNLHVAVYSRSGKILEFAFQDLHNRK